MIVEAAAIYQKRHWRVSKTWKIILQATPVTKNFGKESCRCSNRQSKFRIARGLDYQNATLIASNSKNKRHAKMLLWAKVGDSDPLIVTISNKKHYVVADQKVIKYIMNTTNQQQQVLFSIPPPTSSYSRETSRAKANISFKIFHSIKISMVTTLLNMIMVAILKSQRLEYWPWPKVCQRWISCRRLDQRWWRGGSYWNVSSSLGRSSITKIKWWIEYINFDVTVAADV